MNRFALVRALSPRIAECELTFAERQPIDSVHASAQHEAYERVLESLGCALVRADDAPEHADGVFVEDAAVVVDEIAVITRPGAESRRGEVDSIARALTPYRAMVRIEAPATIDGGDVLQIGDTLYVGRSSRTNDEGIEQLRGAVAPFDYNVVAVDFRGCLHLKSAVTAVGDETLLFNPVWVDPIDEFEMIAVDPSEPFSANVLRIDGVILAMAEHPRTADLLGRRGYDVMPVTMGELLKAEAGVTCCSIIFRS